MTIAPATAPPVLRFNPEPHEYFLDDGRIPSVTQALERAGLSADWSFLGEDRDWFMERGTAIHTAIALALRGVLDVDTVDPLIEPFVANALQLVKDLEITPLAFELRVACPILRVGGTLDIFGPSRVLDRFVLLDWKGVTYQRLMDIQVEGGYRTLLRSSIRHGLIPGTKITLDQVREARAAIVTLGGSRAKPHWIDKPNLEAAVFAGAVARYHWEGGNGSAPHPAKGGTL